MVCRSKQILVSNFMSQTYKNTRQNTEELFCHIFGENLVDWYVFHM